MAPFSSCLTLNNIVILKSGLHVTEGHLNWYYIRKLNGCGFIFAFHRNYGSILSIISQKKRDIFVKNLDFSTPLHSILQLGGFRQSIVTPFGMEKLEWCGYPMVKKNFEDMCNHLDRIPACVV